jgi:hypothetical protein
VGGHGQELRLRPGDELEQPVGHRVGVRHERAQLDAREQLGARHLAQVALGLLAGPRGLDLLGHPDAGAQHGREHRLGHPRQRQACAEQPGEGGRVRQGLLCKRRAVKRCQDVSDHGVPSRRARTMVDGPRIPHPRACAR